MDQDAPNDKPALPGWNHTGPVPVQVSPFAIWPPDPGRMLRWLAVRWLTLAENTILLGLSYVSMRWMQAPLEQMRELRAEWLVDLWLRNLSLMILVAGGLHLWFYTFRGQSDRLKYDPRDLIRRGRQFTLGGQVRDNMFWTLTSGVGIWTAYEALMLWGMANGWLPVVLFADRPVWFVLAFLLTPVWISFHFYWIHRALHWGPLYRLAHSLHHRNSNVGPWSGISMHPVEHVMFFSSVLIHLVVPVSPWHILFHLQHQALTGASSHTGYESLLVNGRRALAVGTFHHQLHHRYFEVNYGNLDVPWDKWFGSFHDGTPQGHAMMKERRRRFGR